MPAAKGDHSPRSVTSVSTTNTRRSKRPGSGSSVRSSRAAPKRQSFAVRTAELALEDANLMQDVRLDEGSIESLPDQMRSALHRHRLRVMDIFRQVHGVHAEHLQSRRTHAFDWNACMRALPSNSPSAPLLATSHYLFLLC